jgi:predicted aspartyl protease
MCGILSVTSYGQVSEGERRKSGAGEVPFELVNGFLIVFEGRIGNLTGLKFMLDTGATNSIVNRKLARKLRIPLHRKQIFDFDKFVDADWGIFPDVNFGPIQLADVSMLVGDLARFSDFAKEVDCIIGWDLLSLNSFTIDYDTKTVFFSPLEQPASSLKPNPVGMILQLQLQNHPVDVLVDTGIQGVVLFEDRLLSQIPNLHIEDETKGITIRGWLHAKLATLPRVRLDTTSVNPRVLLVKGPPGYVLPGVDGYLGPSSLKPHRIDFNFRDNRGSFRIEETSN